MCVPKGSFGGERMWEEGRGEMKWGPAGLISYCPQPLVMSLASREVLH